jgi:hypothetical protein
MECEEVFFSMENAEVVECGVGRFAGYRALRARGWDGAVLPAALCNVGVDVL